MVGLLARLKVPLAAASRVVARLVDVGREIVVPTIRAAMPTFVEPQLCGTADKPPSGSGWLHEIKFDGYRTQVRVQDGKVRLFTRRGQDWTDKFAALAKATAGLPDAVLDGEVVALDANGLPDYSALHARIALRDTDGLVFYAFDLLFLDGVDLRRTPLVERKATLAKLIAGMGESLVRYVDHFDNDGREVVP